MDILTIHLNGGKISYPETILRKKFKLIDDLLDEFKTEEITLDLKLEDFERVLDYTNTLNIPSKREDWLLLFKMADYLQLNEKFSLLLITAFEGYFRRSFNHSHYGSVIRDCIKVLENPDEGITSREGNHEEVFAIPTFLRLFLILNALGVDQEIM